MKTMFKTMGDFFNEFSKAGRKRFGQLGEMAAARMLEKQGYQVSFCREGARLGDLRAVHPTTGDSKLVECKIARRSRFDGKWRFTLTSTGNGRTDYRHSDVIVLMAVHDVTGFITPFVIPVAAAGERCQICITSAPETYAGMWAGYRQSALRGLRL